MRILHTSDWHLGKTLEGRDRLDEQEAFTNEIVEIVEREAVDLVLLAGDVFDVYNPPALAEELFYETIDRLADGGRRAVVVIAGNHDQPERLTASNPLAGRHGISILGLPSTHLPPGGRDGRVKRVNTAPALVELHLPSCDETAVVAALAFPSEARLNAVLNESTREDLLQQAYSARVRAVFEELAANFRPDAVNLAMSHLFVNGSVESGLESGERAIQVGGAYSVTSDDLPERAQYVALGHLHRPQTVGGQETVRYSGSPLSYSFSEAEQSKSVVLVEASPGRSAVVKTVPLQSGRPLVRMKVLDGFEEAIRRFEAGEHSEAWIDLEIHVERPLQPNEIVELRKRRDRILHVRSVFEAKAADGSFVNRRNMSLEDLFGDFHRRKTGADPNRELTALFLELASEIKDEREPNDVVSPE